MLKLARHIVRDERGGAVVDFVVLLPILLVMFIGVVEGTNLLQLDRKVVAAAQTTADLVTQRREVTNAQLDDFLQAAGLILEPFPSSAASIGIVGVRYNASTGVPEIDWTRAENGGSVPNALSVAQGLGEEGEGVVVVRVTYSYTPLFLDFALRAMVLEETAVLRPRRSRFVQGPVS